MDHSIGDRVVNSGNLRMGSVLEINLQEDKLKIQYSDGITEWVENVKVTNLLIDESDFSSKSFIQD
tara:strand:- start:34 stop:231 length:198 start_codon:yes stop_codon:yes gene_type:complete